MGIAQIIVTYAVSWWLMLLFVLPINTAPVAIPEKGHAASAPATTGLRRKFKLATWLALIPLGLVYFLNRYSLLGIAG